MSNPTSGDHQGRVRPIDVRIGAALRTRRVQSGLSQQDLADLVGVSYQQLHKYERGANRLTVSRLLAFCEFLHFGIEEFFAEVAGEEAQKFLSKDRLGLALAKACAQLKTPEDREAVLTITRALLNANARTERPL